MEGLSGKSYSLSDGSELWVVSLLAHIGDVSVAQPIQEDLVGLSVELVPYDGMTDVIEVHPNLVGSSCIEVARDQRPLPQLLAKSEACVRVQSTFHHAPSESNLALDLVIDGCLYFDLDPLGCAVDDRQVLLSKGLCSLPKLLLEEHIGREILGQDEYSAGLSI